MPSAAFTGIPASMTADGSSSPMRGPAACQKISSMISAGISSRHPVTVFPVGMCQARVKGMSASSPARVRIASEYEEPGSRVIAITRRMTSGYDISRRRSRGRRRPFITAFPAILSITPSPRCASRPPRRTRSGSHASASTVPSRFTNAGAVRTGRKNPVSSPFAGAIPATVTDREL